MPKSHISQTTGCRKFVDPSKWQQDLPWDLPWVVFQYVYPSDNQKCPKNTTFGYLWPYNEELVWVSIFYESLVVKSWLTSQNDGKNEFTVDALNYIHPSDNQKWPKKAFLVFFSDPYMMKFENLPYHENYILN